MATVEEICKKIKQADREIGELRTEKRRLIIELNEALKDMLPSGLYVEEMRDE